MNELILGNSDWVTLHKLGWDRFVVSCVLSPVCSGQECWSSISLLHKAGRILNV